MLLKKDGGSSRQNTPLWDSKRDKKLCEESVKLYFLWSKHSGFPFLSFFKFNCLLRSSTRQNTSRVWHAITKLTPQRHTWQSKHLTILSDTLDMPPQKRFLLKTWTQWERQNTQNVIGHSSELNRKAQWSIFCECMRLQWLRDWSILPHCALCSYKQQQSGIELPFK